MEVDRIKRYKDKLEYLGRTIENLEEWTNNIDLKKFIANLELLKQYGIYHAFQISIELITDIIAMIIKDLKIIPKDDYSNIILLEEKKIISPDLAKKLREVNGLRNRTIHDYNGLDNNLAYTGLLGALKDLKEFKEVASKWLKKSS